jgi:photosystem II stability/assembly factor-like uncharacterized protein
VKEGKAIRISFVLVAILIVLCNAVLQARSENLGEEITINPALVEWKQTNGPPGGGISEPLQNPDRHNELYALANGQLYRSEDKGDTWNLMNKLKDIAIVSIEIYNDTLFLTCHDGIYYYDKNENLVKILDSFFGRIKISGNKLFVTSTFTDIKDVKILYSDLTLGDFEWVDVSPSEEELDALKLPPTDAGFFHEIVVSNLVCVGTRILTSIIVEVGGSGEYTNGQLYASENLGASWFAIDFGVPSDVVVSTIVQDTGNIDHLIVSFKHNRLHEALSPLSDLVRESFDGGVSWSLLTDLSLESNGVTDVDVVGSSYYLLCPYDGLQIINLTGSDYSLIASPTLSEYENVVFWLGSIVFDLDDQNIVYGKTGSVWSLGLIKSEDGMKTWKKMDRGIVASSPSIVLVDPGDSNKIYTSGNVIQEKYLTRDGGITWAPFSPTNTGDELKIDPHNPNHMLLITEMTDIYESYDGGNTFKQINEDFWSTKIFDLEFDSNVPGKVYASTIGVGVCEYDPDTGEWLYLTGSPDYAYFLKVDPDNSSILYATNGPKKFENHSSLWKYSPYEQKNYGWSEILRVENSTGMTSITFDPTNHNRIYVGVTGKKGTIYVSDDKGETWSKLNQHLTFTTIWGHSQLQISPDDENSVYAGTWGGGTFKTDNGGKDWVLLDEDHTFSSTFIAISEKNPNIIYACDRTQAKIHRSDDAGSSWYTYYDFGSSYMLSSAVAIDPNNPDLIYASAFAPPLAHQGAFLKIEKGEIIADMSSLLPRSALDIEIDGNDPDTLYVSTHVYGVFKSTDGGDSWARLDDRGTGLPRTGIYDVDVDPLDSQIVYATALSGPLPDYMLPSEGFENLEGKAGVYKSLDGGEHWTLILETLSEARGIDIDSVDNNNLYVADMMGGVWVSNDGGAVWRQENTEIGSISMTSVKVKGDHIYASTQGSGVYSGIVNSDNSVTWDTSRSNKPKAKVHKIQIEIDPENSNRIFASAYPGGLLRSDDGGLHWNDKNFLTPSIRVEDPAIQGYYSFAVDPGNTDTIWMGVYGKGMFVSYDAMEYDTLANGVDNKMMGKKITKVVINPENSSEVYVATEEGVFKTVDSGQHWEEMNEGMETLDVRSLKIESADWPPFVDDFEDGKADDWNPSPLEGGWFVIKENNNYVYQGIGHQWANSGIILWRDYVFQAKVKLIQGGVHVNFRKNNDGRYFLGMDEGGFSLNRQFNQWQDFAELARISEPLSLGQWFDLRIELEGSRIRVKVNGALKFDYVDSYPLLNGAIAFESLPDSQVYVDDVEVVMTSSTLNFYAGTAGYGVYRCDYVNEEWENLGRAFGGGYWTAWERRMYQFSSILFDPITPGRIYLGHFPSGFFISDDNGHSWKDSSLGLGNDGIFSLTMDPYDQNVIWAGTYNGVAKSEDNGRTWELKDNGWPSEQWPFTVAIDEDNPNIMYASTKNGQNKGLAHRNSFLGVVMKSLDGGENWFKIMNGLDEKREFYSLLIYPPNHKVLFLSTSNGVYISRNSGVSWQGMNVGLSTTNNFVRDNVADNLVLTSDNSQLILGLQSHGVWKANLTEATESGESVPPVTVNDYDGSWHSSDFTINLSASDTSGLCETYYSVNNGAIQSTSANGQPWIDNEGGSNILEYWSVDAIGNEELPHVLSGIKLDKTAPTGSIQIDNGASITTSTSVTLSLTAADEVSGVDQIRFSNDGVWDSESWETLVYSKSWTLTSGDGEKTVYLQIKDQAGLTSTYSDTITLTDSSSSSSSGETEPSPSPQLTPSPSPSPAPTLTPSPIPSPTPKPEEQPLLLYTIIIGLAFSIIAIAVFLLSKRR